MTNAYEYAKVLQIIPDCLRGAASAFTLLTPRWRAHT